MKIGIVGNGFVGKATAILSDNIVMYDINPILCSPLGTTIGDVAVCDVVFVCVPTPMDKEGKCCLNIVNSVCSCLREVNPDLLIVLRSTVPIGTCEALGVYFMPEFLTERNWHDDFVNCENWIFGLLGGFGDEYFVKVIGEIFMNAVVSGRIKYNKLLFCKTNEAEAVKLFRNAYLATKVSFCNEFNDLCMMKDVNYENVRRLAVLDSRIGTSHTMVPGIDGKYGFGGTCFPKDLNSVIHQLGGASIVLEAVRKRNEEVDRAEHDWKGLVGRSVTKN